MASSKLAKKTKSKEHRSIPGKTKSLKSSTSSCSDGSISMKKGKSKRKERVSTGGLKLLKRDAVTMSKVTGRKGRKVKRVVLFNRKGNPYGKVAALMQSYIGVLARRSIPIIRDYWKDATVEEKDKIWSRVVIPFVLGPEHKKMVLESAAAKWRQFKSVLTSKYVIPFLDNPEALKYPPDDYPFILPEHWTTFVAKRTKSSFLETRRKQQAKRAMNKYPHRVSRKGYAGLEAELIKDMDVDEVERETLWVKAREGPDDQFKDEPTKEKATEIETLKRKVAAGEEVVEEADDILTKALGPEHGGRVRGVGGFVTPSAYFQLPKRKRETMESAIRISVMKILAEGKEQLIVEAKEKITTEAKEELIAEAKKELIAEAKEELMAKAKEEIIAAEKAKWLEEYQSQLKPAEDGNFATDEVIRSGHASSHTVDVIAKEISTAHGHAVVNKLTAKQIANAFDVAEKRTAHRKKSAKVIKLKVSPSSNQVNEKVKETVADIATPIADIATPIAANESNGAEVKCKLALGSVDNIVAYATVMESDEPNALIHGSLLGECNSRVSIYMVVDEFSELPFPVKDEIENVKQAMGSWVAWQKDLIIVEKPAKIPSEKKRKRKKIQEVDSETEFSMADLSPSLPASLKMLCLWGEDGFKDDKAITFCMGPEVFGYPRKSFILGSDVHRMATMREATGNCIAVYQRYLYVKLAAYKMLDMVAFVDPAQIGAEGSGTEKSRAKHIRDRLVTAKPGQMFMLPYNSGDHWVLTIIDPEQDTVYFMDPLRRRLPTKDWIDIVETAIRMYNENKKKAGSTSAVWKNLAGIPPQPTNKECGYFVMRYMRDIIEDKDLSLFPIKWGRRGSSTYTQEDIDQVRNEWGKFVVNKFVHEP